jgi:hypothetical protein
MMIDKKDAAWVLVPWWVVNKRLGKAAQIFAYSGVEAIWKCGWKVADCDVRPIGAAV